MSEQYPNFRMLARGLHVTEIAAELAPRADLWEQITVRQDYEGSAHKDTQSIYLRVPSSLDDVFNHIDCVDTRTLGELPHTMAALQHIARFLQAREVGRIMLTRLKGGGVITPHVDEGAYARYYARFHLPIVTNPGCIFHCGGERVRMSAGELWWFNHQLAHRVENMGPDRIHLIVDATAPGFTGALAHPIFK